jgi:hypothetical protein
VNEDELQLPLTADDLTLIVNVLNTACNGGHPIPEWEFRTLIGFERHEAQALLARLSAYLRNT